MTEREKIDPFQDPGFRCRLQELRAEQEAGEITGLELFQKVRLSAAGVPWVAPFRYRRRGVLCWEAFKIRSDPAFKVIVRLWLAYGPGVLIVSEWKHGKVMVNLVVEQRSGVEKS